MAVHDVFLIDSDFKIERPTRYYRQGLNLIKHPEITLQEEREEKKEENHDAVSIKASTKGTSIRSKISRVFHRNHQQAPSERGGASPRTSRVRASSVSSPTSGETSAGAELARQITPILDPSTNTNPLLGPDDHGGGAAAGEKGKRRADVSKHTFYIENSQMRLKLFARNEVSTWDFGRCCTSTEISWLATNAAVDSCAGKSGSRVALYWQEQI